MPLAPAVDCSRSQRLAQAHMAPPSKAPARRKPSAMAWAMLPNPINPTVTAICHPAFSVIWNLSLRLYHGRGLGARGNAPFRT